MAKHRLLVVGSGKKDSGRVVLQCAHCPRYIELYRETLYAILVERKRLLVLQTKPDQVKEWSVCKGLQA